MALENIFFVGNVVVFKTHPLLKNKRIQGDGKYVPPVLVISEVNIEDIKKREYEEESGKRIAERIKYTCYYFDDDRGEFRDVILYESMLSSYENLIIERISQEGNSFDGKENLKKEMESYKVPVYDFGKIVRFKTKKIEIFKKRSSKKIPVNKEGIDKDNIKEIIQYVVNYSSPDFILCGFKKNENNNLYYPNGKVKRLVSPNLYKVKWFNPFQHKFSEQYLPAEFFTDEMFFNKEDEIARDLEVNPNSES
ncbi:hypothetical protein V5097_12410 [Arenibacter palladensis]|uniref:hypothetical protein n=1 Tax=Arenibacter palladensis TaxID=237373 RepID=UPI002FD54693